MVLAAISIYRDRTSEFRSLTERLKKTTGNDWTAAKYADEVVFRSEFNRKASSIGLAIHETSQKIARLAELAKRSSMFDDPALEIQELSSIIKNDITALNAAVSGQILQNTETSDGEYSNDRVVHATMICDDLKSKLMGITKQFKDVLTRRTESIKAHENRKQIFSVNSLRDNSLMPLEKMVTEPPPWSNASDVTSTSQSPLVPSRGVYNGNQLRVPSSAVYNGNQLRRRLATESIPSHHMEMSMLQQVVPREESSTLSRSVALQNVESTISELGGIFTQLATMVSQQGELAIRIDDNIDETFVNVEGARGALLKNLARISSNRWLIIKLFFVLIIFMLIFIFFVL